MQKIIFYTQLNSPACEEANRMLMEIAYDVPLEVDVIDISHAHNHQLEGVYSSRIPVLAKSDGPELDWPFTLEQIMAYLHE